MIRPLMQAEWLRFRSHPGNRWIIATFLLVFLLNAAWSGWTAREHRHQQVAEAQAWRTMLEHERSGLLGTPKAGESLEQKARTAFEFARHGSPPAQLPTLGGLTLGTTALKLLSPVSHVTVTNRQADDRKSETLTNPRLEAIGEIDFATLTALLLPILCICLCYGLLQEDRASGIWRLTTMTHPQAWQVLGASLLIRWCVVLLCLALPSALAFGLDPGASLLAYLSWIAAGAGFAAIWIILGGLACLLPVSAGASASALLAVWIVSSFVLPATLSVQGDAKAPSRMASIAALRVIQLDVDEQAPALLAQWYAQNADTTVPRQSHVWPVSFMPRYTEESLRARAIFRRFDAYRATRDSRLAAWALVSPPIGLLDIADRLAGIDAARYHRYALAVDDYEDRWRDYLTPRIMFYRGLTPADLDALPTFAFSSAPTSVAWPLVRLWVSALVLLLTFLLFRHHANTP
ncbi:MAG: DUF3526 domain-containing protein [Zoogloea sp.]|uniref:DUF3526 domain-containing protein n=1 Tax=Zoogloea sp. TaxID=49181 RepID=UPI00262E5596|nr:DUF3526 domain-containing protein [Zoogloea sp.]MDD2989043.1 DUF3526 domain-containing protein [Zoogloea sp.]